MLTYSASHETPKRISRVVFRVLSAEEIRRLSVVRVTESTLYTRGLPTIGGVNDHRMGKRRARMRARALPR